MRKLLIFLLTALEVTLILITVPVAMDVLRVTDVFAYGKPCKGDDKFVQHEVTHKCKCLPAQAVAPPWHIVDGTTCPAIVDEITPTNTPFQPIITWTPVPKLTHTQTSTSSPEPSRTPQLTATNKPLIQTVPALPVATGGVCIENDCDPTWALIHVRQTEAAVKATELIWKMTTQP